MTAIADELDELLRLVITVPDVSQDKAKAILSYEGRSRLANIIGYAEELLEDSSLQPHEGDQVQFLRAGGKQIVMEIENL